MHGWYAAPVAVTKIARSGSTSSQVNGLISAQLKGPSASEGTLSRPPSERASEGLPSQQSSGSRASSGDLDFAVDANPRQPGNVPAVLNGAFLGPKVASVSAMMTRTVGRQWFGSIVRLPGLFCLEGGESSICLFTKHLSFLES